MAPERLETSVTLFGTPPWGFRISGGKEFGQPLVVSRVTPGSVSSKGGISAGDVVLAIDGEYVSGLTQSQFEAKLAKATGSVMLVIEKNGATVGQDGVIKSRNDYGAVSDWERMARHNRSAKPFVSSSTSATPVAPAEVAPTSPTSLPAGFRPIKFNPKK